MEITREKVFTDLVCVTNIGQISPEEELKLAETLGKVQKANLEIKEVKNYINNLKVNYLV